MFFTRSRWLYSFDWSLFISRKDVDWASMRTSILVNEA